MGLTDFEIKNSHPQKKRYEVSDGKGLAIRVMPSGKKSWVYRYVFDGIPRRMTIGTYPALSLADARKEHGRAMQDVQNGIDPGAKKIAEKQKRKAAPFFEDLEEEFWIHELRDTPSGEERRRLVEKDAMPAWGKCKVEDITRRDAVLLLRKVRERAPVTANRLQTVLVRMFNFASEEGLIEGPNPLSGLRKPKEKARSRVLKDKELKLLWSALDTENSEIDIYRLTKLGLKLILLTGQRPQEVIGLEWAEIRGDTWDIPKRRRKSGDPHSVPLTDMAQDVLNEARLYSGDSQFVFRSPYQNKDAPIARTSVARSVARHLDEIGIKKRFTPHDLRRTVRTRMAELGVKDIVAEKVLGHKLQGLLAVYNQHDYSTEKRQALEAWERKLRQILEIDKPKMGKIVELRR